MQEDSNELKQLYFIVICGPPASGKSTLAQQIYEDYLKTTKLQNQEEKGVLIIADCFEEYLRNHSIQQLEQFTFNYQNWNSIRQLKLNRHCFNEQNWKQSRQFIKNNLQTWLSKWKVIVLDDDLLLKSQRKQMRHIAESLKAKYLQITLQSSLEECIQNVKNRITNLQGQELSEKIVTECYHKFERDDHPYILRWCSKNSEKKLTWTNIVNCSKTMIIQHPQLHEKAPVSQDNANKDNAQVSIRKFISQIMTNKDLQKKYFPAKNIKQISASLGHIKKNYSSKTKSLEGFICYLESITE